MLKIQKHKTIFLTILLWSCVSVRANEVSVSHLLKDFYANGNPISVEDTAANTLRVMQWDEENRLQSLGDDGYVSRYTYNHAGERVIKSHGPTTVAFVNGAPQGILWHDKDNWTMYVSPYMVVNADRFTKHYYAGSQRIASKIGAGEFNNLYDASKACVTAGQKDYAERMNLITQSRNDYYAALGIPPGPPTAKGIYGEAEYSGMYGDYTITPLGNYDVPSGWPMKPYKRPYGGTPGPPVMYEKPSDPEDEGAGYGYSNAEGLEENDIYFYHSDHLGSTSYITDKDGNATQFVSYKPYGESLIDEHNTTFEQPWKFNGKELDSETGLYYYGARYYDSRLAMWYGVDALAEKYPNMGGYVYCAGNPVKLVDPDGNEIKGITKQDAKNFRDDIYKVLADDKFANIRTLIDIKRKSFISIDAAKLNSAIDGLSLTDDERAYITMITYAINSKEVYKVEYVGGEYTSMEGAEAFVNHMNKELGDGIGNKMVTPDGKLSSGFIKNSGNGLNVPTPNGSHSFIYIGNNIQGDERPITSGHEVFGHGIPAAKKLSPAENNANAIRTDNLIRRIMGLPQRDGSDHGGYKEGHINDQYILPILK